MPRRHNFQTFSWFNDLFNRGLLDLDPPYQRRSVWNQRFKDYFVETVLLGYPSPAIFLYEEITEHGLTMYHVVDGKQRLTTLFEFVRDQFVVSDESQLVNLRGQYFSAFNPQVKTEMWGYQFLVEYVPSNENAIISGIFDRINRNVAKLSHQELRHAKFDGQLMSAAEELTDWMFETLPRNMPRFTPQSKKQMKDTEFVALLLLLLEEGVKAYSQDDLDDAFAKRDDDWEGRQEIDQRFRNAILLIRAILEASPDLATSRLRNQADFYSLFGALEALQREGAVPAHNIAGQRLATFIARVENEAERGGDQALGAYFDAARSASNDAGPRTTRINYLKGVITGNQ